MARVVPAVPAVPAAPVALVAPYFLILFHAFSCFSRLVHTFSYFLALSHTVSHFVTLSRDLLQPSLTFSLLNLLRTDPEGDPGTPPPGDPRNPGKQHETVGRGDVE